MMKVAVPQRFKLRVVPDVKTLIFGSGREVHYIGGTEVLPPPLEGMRESEMINRLGTEYAEDAKKVLIEHNLRLVVYIAKKFDNTGVGVEDLISIGTIGLIKAINTFNPTKKIKLATYASRCIENEILMYLRRNSKTKMEVSIDEPLNVDWDGNELLLSDILGTEEDTIYKDLENEAERKLLIRALNKLNSREKLIVSMRFGLDNPDGKEIIARDNSVSIQRKEDLGKAYYHCHTDITIPYEELGKIEVNKKDGGHILLLEHGRFVLPGTEILNEPLKNIDK